MPNCRDRIKKPAKSQKSTSCYQGFRRASTRLPGELLHYIMHNHFKSGAGRENSDFASLMYVITSLPCFLAMCLFNGQSFPARNLSSYPYAKFYVTSRPQGRQDEFYSKCPISLVMGEEAMYFSKLQISVNGLFYVKNKIIGRPPLAKILRPLKPCCTKY